MGVKRRCLVFLIAIVMVGVMVSTSVLPVVAAAADPGATSSPTATTDPSATPGKDSNTSAVEDNGELIVELQNNSMLEGKYYQYLEKHAAVPTLPTGTKIVLNSKNYLESSDGAKVTLLDSYEGVSNVIRWENQGKVTYEFNVSRTGLYAISVQYFPLNTKKKTIELTAYINGELPFREASQMQLQVMWEDTEDIPTDKLGNQLRPDQAETQMWHTQLLRDVEGLSKYFTFYLEQGKNTITLDMSRGEMVLGEIDVFAYEAPMTYEEYKAQFEGKPNDVPADFIDRIQAEDPLYKSDASLYPVYDRSSIMTDPSHASKLMLNTIGGTNWANAFQTLVWEIEAPADGYYKIGFKARQNLLLGLFTTREFRIDGNIPFQEVEELEFKYSTNWYVLCPSNADTDEPYLFYLTKGKHQLSLSAVFGEVTETLNVLNKAVYMLNAVYRRMIMVVGTTRDPYRDYRLDIEIPGLIHTLKEVSTMLEDESARLVELNGRGGSEGAIMDRIAEQMRSFIKDPDTIATRINTFKSNIDALASWILQMQSQSLEMDYIEIAAPDVEFGKTKAAWYTNLGFSFKVFLASFFEDYNIFSQAEADARSVSVWIYGGRDQAQIVNDLITNQFTPKTGISINLKLVQADLITAIVAGKGPDLSMSMGRGIPVNMAMRGALLPLDEFEGFDEVRSRFEDDAMLPYTYLDKTYAIPVTTDFYVMFYRTDILDQLGIEVPKTWDDLSAIIPVLQRNHMEMGLPYGGMDAYQLLNAGMGSRNIFAALLLQRGGTFYTDDYKQTRLDEDVAVEAFTEWCEFYTKYGFSLYYNFYNRFRSGEMPIGIASYSTYAQLAAAAPEIRGMWGMALVPGTEVDGEIVNSIGASGSAAGIVKGCKDPEAAWEFISWWTSAETQGEFGMELENLLGTAARYTPASIEAFRELPWSAEELAVLEEQRANVIEIPEIPGGYYTARCLDNAFRSVINNSENPREMLYKYNLMINEEITRKRQEFKLD
nr:extracellular solute-binding protein [bacterium]